VSFQSLAGPLSWQLYLASQFDVHNPRIRRNKKSIRIYIVILLTVHNTIIDKINLRTIFRN